MAFEDKYLFNKNLSKQESKFDSSRLAITTLITNFSIRTPQCVTVLNCVWYLSSRQVYMKLSFFFSDSEGYSVVEAMWPSSWGNVLLIWWSWFQTLYPAT